MSSILFDYLLNYENQIIDISNYLLSQILYVPAGFPHTTDTLCEMKEETDSHLDPSIHLTVGIDTHIWGLNYASLREASLKRSGLSDKVLLTNLDEKLYWDLQSTCNLGFLGQDGESSDPSVVLEGTQAETDRLKIDSAKIVDKLVSLMRVAEPNRWPVEVTDKDIAVSLTASQVVARHIRHHKEVTEIFRAMYSDVAFQTTPTKMNLSIFRSQPYFQKLEETMAGLVDWSQPIVSTKSTGKEGKGEKDGKGGKRDKSVVEKKTGFGK